MAINLLPTDLSPKGPIVKIATLLKNLAIVSFLTFFLAVLGMAAFFVLNSLTINSLSSRSEELKVSIKSLEATEQRLILVKDRLTKAKQVLGVESGLDEVDGLGKIVSGLSADVSLSEAIVAKDSLDTTFVASSSQGLTQLMAQVISQDAFKKVELVSFSFNPNAGYVPSFVFSNK
ncbi:MAG: hypothetical protein ACOYT7_00230 [Patescibacteria group bacterium]